MELKDFSIKQLKEEIIKRELAETEEAFWEKLNAIVTLEVKKQLAKTIPWYIPPYTPPTIPPYTQPAVIWKNTTPKI